MTKSRGIGRGGARSGAGRKPKPEAPPLDIPASLLNADPDEIMEASMRLLAANGQLKDAARVAYMLARTRASAAHGKKQLARAAAETAGVGSGWGDDLATPDIKRH